MDGVEIYLYLPKNTEPGTYREESAFNYESVFDKIWNLLENYTAEMFNIQFYILFYSYLTMFRLNI